MRVLYFAPPVAGLLGECGGVLKGMHLREEAVGRLGHEVEYLSPWSEPNWSKYDLCHLYMANGDSLSVGATISKYLPLVVSPIIDTTQPNAVLRANVWIDRRVPKIYTHLGSCATLCRMADMVSLRSREEEDRLTHGLGVRTRSMIVPDPATPGAVQPAAGRFAEYSSKPYILFVGDAGNPRKNMVRLIKAVQGLDTELLVGGMISEGKVGQTVRRLAEECRNVRLIGFIEEAEKAFLSQHAQALVLPSIMEGIGQASLEAALHGATVVISKNGGPRDYFGDLAYYVDPLSTKDIRRKIQQAIDQPRDASQHIRDEFSFEKMGKAMATCYETCIDNAPASKKREQSDV